MERRVVSVDASLPQSERDEIDRMLFREKDAKSCFWREVSEEGIAAPSFSSCLEGALDFYVCYEGDKAVGCVSIRHLNFEDVYMSSLCVDWPCRKKGVGSMLVRHAQNRHDRILLTVYKHDPVLIRYYSRLGFKREGKEGNYTLMRWSR